MTKNQPQPIFYVFYVSLIVALGGFLMGFDASVISGVVKFIEPEFSLTKIQLGWAVASLSLTATFAMITAGPLSDRFGRKVILKIAAALFFVSAIASAFAPSFLMLVMARMLGGLGVGAALIIAPMYIAEIGPAKYRGRMVSLNQLNIVLGISVAFFTNYLILQAANSDADWVQTLGVAQWNWRWMLGIEAIPALVYFICLSIVPESPRWLMMKGRAQEATVILKRALGEQNAAQEIQQINKSISLEHNQAKGAFMDLLKPSMRLVMIVGISIAILQQITGINAVFFYAPMIFEQTGLGTDASFLQAILVGITNVVFTLIAIALIDKIGRKSLLIAGVSGIIVCMFSLAYQFNAATYTLTAQALNSLSTEIDIQALQPILGATFNSDLAFKSAITDLLGATQAGQFESTLVSAAIQMNGTMILVSILGFVACFAVSLGPVMWVLFSELFPNRIRGIAISFVGLINSGVSFLVQLIFPWELANLGATFTFAIYGGFAFIGLLIILKFLPETKGKTLEELETILVK
ncbi:sugar porter family MFS transporter [uncultured Paraglaciecola sp.]|jgi:sugar porter (SP) family MFS transporter|uniref:sugar porter family MFS transporter n=1 Tax=uncultured Paraglaciecola sp. TaxID=1765024 RepID=UPI0026327267|nr:sugar porter family MFS transporter [uncultured Paraglaciecola sp.]|tara:strand:+ start:1807 stop:3378 length:1572 start_codon:yes stop_codon:yes gene_type:complete